MDARFLADLLVGRTGNAISLGELQQIFQLGILKAVERLIGQRIAINQEQDAPEPLSLERPVHERDGHAGLAGPRRHADESGFRTVPDRALDRRDGVLLIGAQIGVVEGLLRQPLSTVDRLLLKLAQKVFR